MKRFGPVLAATTFILGTTTLFGQTPAPPPPDSTRARAETTDTDATFGRIKEFTAGQKIVIDVDDAIDKTFDLTDKDLKVNIERGLKVGDPVKVVEHEKVGKTHTVAITKHSGGGVTHGDKDPAKKQ